MRILFFGDVMGASGRQALVEFLPALKAKYCPDVIIANGENAAHGFGLTPKICEEFYAMGINVITSGNHIWDKKEIIAEMDRDEHVLRPLNYPAGTPGKGYLVYTLKDGRKILVMNAMGNLFMENTNLAFPQTRAIVDGFSLGKTVQAIFMDFHAETTSEKMAFGYFLDGRVTAVVGTHTHVPTSDFRILPQGTAYITDVGMCGDHDSVIGMHKDVPIQRFLRLVNTDRLAPAEGKGTLCGVFVESDDQTGKAIMIKQIVVGPHLHNVGG